MKKSLFLIALAMMSFASIHNANAQNDNQRNNRIAEFRARQTEQLVQDLKLTAEQKTKFEAVFKNYQEELMALRQDRPQTASSNDQELTDEQATARLQEVFQRQAEQIQQSQMRLDIQKKYCSEFSAFLTPQQLLRVFAPQTGRGRNGQQRGGRGGGFGGPGGGFGGGFGGPGGGF